MQKSCPDGQVQFRSLHSQGTGSRRADVATEIEAVCLTFISLA